MKLIIRAMMESDLDQADEVVRLAYHSSSRREALTLNLQLQPSAWVVACRGERLVGLVGGTNYGALAYIGLMAVRPDMQRQGIGRALLQYQLTRLEELHCPTILLDASPEGAELYRLFGFQADHISSLWTCPVAQARTQLQSRWQGDFLRIVPLDLDNLPEVVQFDTPRFGADRAMVLRAYCSLASDRSFVAYTADQQIGGYLCVRNHIIGPYVADRPDVAEALLRHAFTLSFQQDMIVIINEANEQAVELLEQYHFTCARRLQHMWRGEPATGRVRGSLYGQASFALG